MKQIARFEQALTASDPGRALRALALELSSEGLRRQEIYDLCEQFVLYLRGAVQDRQADEDIVLGVMDALSGGCHPNAQLLADQ